MHQITIVMIRKRMMVDLVGHQLSQRERLLYAPISISNALFVMDSLRNLRVDRQGTVHEDIDVERVYAKFDEMLNHILTLNSIRHKPYSRIFIVLDDQSKRTWITYFLEAIQSLRKVHSAFVARGAYIPDAVCICIPQHALIQLSQSARASRYIYLDTKHKRFRIDFTPNGGLVPHFFVQKKRSFDRISYR